MPNYSRSVILALIAVAQLIVHCSARVALFIYDKSVLSDTGELPEHITKIPIYTPQRCYSFACYSSRMTGLRWEGTPTDSKMLLFAKKGCTGHNITFVGKYDNIIPKFHGMSDGIGSLIVWEYGMYPTGVFVDKCKNEDA